MGKPRRKTVKHFHTPGDFHELTFSCYTRSALLTDDDRLTRLSPHIDRACAQFSIDLVAFVYMPEHVHLLVYPRLDEPKIDDFLAHLKQPYSKEIKGLLVEAHSPLLQRLTVRERPGKYCFRLWQEGPGYDRNLSTCTYVESSVNYIHLNPVRRGLCKRPTDWPWSSARYYLLDPPKQQFPELPYVHGVPPDFGR